MLSEPNDYKILFVRFDSPSLEGIPNTVTPTIAKATPTYQKQSFTDSVYLLATLFYHWK
jgi:hypothetical protein